MSKYGAIQDERDGQRFDSKLEARLYDQLVLEREHGDVAYFLRQVPLHLPGGGAMRVDFQVFYKNRPTPRYLDAKGKPTAEWLRIKRIVENIYPIKVETWTDRKRR